MAEHYFLYELFNVDTEEVECSERKTPDEVWKLNHILRKTGEPQRWIVARGESYYNVPGYPKE